MNNSIETMYKSKIFPSTRAGRKEFLQKQKDERNARYLLIDQMLDDGYPCSEIAEAAGVSIRTVQRRRVALNSFSESSKPTE